jgi:aerobic carbon-monoxide dehydrogenase medium subunit
MKPPAFEYVAAASTEEVVAELAAHGDEARILAGGQSLMPILNMRLAAPARLVDMNRVAALSYIVERAGGVAIGAMTRQRTAERSCLIATNVPLLAEALPWVGHTAIRTRGTIGGSLAHADPAAELPGVAVCLDARVTVRGQGGERTLAAREFFRDYLTTALAPTELLTEVWFPSMAPRSGAAWIESARRHGDYALVGVAALVTLEGSTVREARLAVIGVDGVPVRALDAERLLISAPLSAESMTAASESLRRTLAPHDDIHATAAYRRHLAGVLAVRALTLAAERARHP